MAWGLISKMRWQLMARLSCSVVALFGCYRLSFDSLAVGASRLFSTNAIVQSRIEPADYAIRFTPNDPEAHYTRALALVNAERLEEAITEFKTAVRLRPHHYYEWLDLGVTLDRVGDQTGAAAALGESIRLAPFFAQPRWQLGNLLYRQGRFSEAFEQLRLGATSNPRLIENMIELAGAASGGNVSTIESLVDPQSARTNLELANFLAKQGMGDDAARHVIKAGLPNDKAELDLSRGIIYQLLAHDQFGAAYSAWAVTHNSANSSRSAERFVNGDFADSIPQDDPGFGWQLPPVPNVSRAIDPAGPGSNTRSIRIEYSGDSPTGNRVISELLLLQPNTRYSVSFMARTDRLVSGGPPVIVITDARREVPKILGQSNPFPPDTRSWTNYTLEFFTEADTQAVNVGLQRLACRETPCPIFGKLWLAKFTLNKN